MVMRRSALAVAGILLLILVAQQPAHAATQDGRPVTASPGAVSFIPNELSVKFTPLLPDVASQTTFAAANGIKELSRVENLPWIRYEITDGEAELDKAAELSASPLVEKAIPIVLGTAFAFPQDPPNDPYWSDQWGLLRTNMLGAWQIAGGGSGTHFVAIVDTGVATNRKGELGTINGHSFVGGGFDDSCGHGTAVAGVAAAYTNNGKGIAGVAYEAPIYSLKIDPTGNCDIDFQAAAEAIQWAVNHGAWAINASWGCRIDEPCGAYADELETAVDNAWNADVPVAVASGNENHSSFADHSPANSYHVITVGGTGPSDTRCQWDGPDRDPNTGKLVHHGANYGDPGLDVSAPCLNIVTLDLAGGYFYESGTSLAAPLVTGLVYLIKSRHPNWTSSQIRSRIDNTADKVGTYSYSWGSYCGGQSAELGCGLIDPTAAVQ